MVVDVSSTAIICPTITSWTGPVAGPTSMALLGSTGARRKTTPTTTGRAIAAAVAGQCVTSRAQVAGTGPVSSGPSSGGTASRIAVLYSPPRTAASTPG